MKIEDLNIGGLYYELDVDSNLVVYVRQFIVERIELERNHLSKVYVKTERIFAFSDNPVENQGNYSTSSGLFDGDRIFKERPSNIAIEKAAEKKRAEVVESERLADLFRCPLTGGKIIEKERGHDFLRGWYAKYEVEGHSQIKVEKTFGQLFTSLMMKEKDGTYIWKFNSDCYVYKGEGEWQRVLPFKDGYINYPDEMWRFNQFYNHHAEWIREQAKEEAERKRLYYLKQIEHVKEHGEEVMFMPKIKQVSPTVLANELVSVQPMAEPNMDLEDFLFPEMSADNPPKVKVIGDYVLISTMNITYAGNSGNSFFFKSHKNNTWAIDIDELSQYVYKPQYQNNWYVFQRA